MFIFIFIFMFILIFVCNVCLSVGRSVGLSVCLSVCLSACLFVSVRILRLIQNIGPGEKASNNSLWNWCGFQDEPESPDAQSPTVLKLSVGQ